MDPLWTFGVQTSAAGWLQEQAKLQGMEEESKKREEQIISDLEVQLGSFTACRLYGSVHCRAGQSQKNFASQGYEGMCCGCVSYSQIKN